MELYEQISNHNAVYKVSNQHDVHFKLILLLLIYTKWYTLEWSYVRIFITGLQKNRNNLSFL